MNSETIMENFLAGKYEQLHCDKCEMTFLTNVFDYDETHVLLEKRSLGLEYYCGAIHTKNLTKVPNIQRIGIIDEEDNPVEAPSNEEIYSGDETDYRFIYIMEKLEHMNDENSAYFDKHIKDLDWKNKESREASLQEVSDKYNPQLATDIAKLYEFYTQHKEVIAWDLHGDNLMQRIESNEIVILDPYTRRA
ncbi:MAG: hypothetical protein DSZ29_02150 [Aquificaceae bacterium]|nr:MAG: hypothetical protein DSZ29_02150 [Aquificaceae bacterium]